MTAKNFFTAFSLCVCILAIIFVSWRIREDGWDFDTAFNMQVADSLAKNFTYLRTYRPAQLYDPGITTNGPVQYLMAAALRFLDLETSRIAVLNLIFVGHILAIFWYSEFAAIIFSLLLPIWRTYLGGTSEFLGEITAITFCVVGLKLLERARDHENGRFPYLACLFWGLAISTKLIALPLIPFLIFISLWNKSAGSWGQKCFEFLKIFSASFGVFVAWYYFSVFHTYVALFLNPPQEKYDQPQWLGLAHFIYFHFSGGMREHFVHPNIFNYTNFNPWTILFIAGAGFSSLYKNRAVLPLFLVTILLTFLPALRESRLLAFLFFLALFGCMSFTQTVKGIIRNDWKIPELIFASIFSIGLLVTAAASFPYAWGTLKWSYEMRFAAFPQHRLETEFGQLPEFIRQIKYPIVTDGWQQFPVLELQTGVRFYDRLNFKNQSLIFEYEKIYLLFHEIDASYNFTPYTTRKFCGPILYDKGGMVLCEFSQSLQLLQQGPDPGA